MFKEIETLVKKRYPHHKQIQKKNHVLTLALDLESQRSSIQKGEKLIYSIIAKQIIARMGNTIKIADRIHLDDILEELKRGFSPLTQSSEIKPALIFSQYILFIEMDYSDNRPVVMMHLADTQKGSVIDVYIHPLQIPIILNNESLTDMLIKKLKTLKVKG